MALFSGWSKYGFDQTCIFFTSKLLQDDSENDDNIDKAWIFDWVPNFPTDPYFKIEDLRDHTWFLLGLFVDILESQNFKIFGFIIIFHLLPGLVNVYITMERSTILMGTFTINGHFQ